MPLLGMARIEKVFRASTSRPCFVLLIEQNYSHTLYNVRLCEYHIANNVSPSQQYLEGDYGFSASGTVLPAGPLKWNLKQNHRSVMDEP